MEQPLVSVIAITRNHSRFCIESLNSILNQTYKNLERIILDAASTDDTPEIIDNWLVENNVNAIFLKEKQLRPITVNANKALTFSKGVYVQLISLDDVLLKNKIQSQVRPLQNARLRDSRSFPQPWLVLGVVYLRSASWYAQFNLLQVN